MGKELSTLKILGIVMIVFGLVMVISPDTLSDMFEQNTMTVGNNEQRMFLSINKENKLLAFEPGTQHKWKLSIKNTGDIDWQNAWFTVRMGRPNSEVVEIDIASARDFFNDFGITLPDTTFGKYAVFKCNSGTDKIQCRDDIKEVWNLRDSNGNSPNNCVDRVCSFTMGPVETGETKSIEIVLDIPETLKVDDPQILLMNGVCATYGRVTMLGYAFDEIDAGKISGEIMMQYLGIVLSIGGGLLILRRF